MTVRIGMLGAAAITPGALVAPARKLDDVELVVVAARDPERARSFAAEHGIPRVAASYKEVVEDPDIDAVYNPLTINLHAPWTIAALRAGKHVLCEKPFAMNAAEAADMVAAATETGRVLVEAFHWRYHPMAARMKEILDEGTIGTLRSIDAVFSLPIVDTSNFRHHLALGGGALMDLGCYPVQWVRYLAGGTPTVTSATAVEGGPGIDLTLTGELSWPSGVTATVHTSMAPDAEIRAGLIARGDDGELRVENPLAPHAGNRLVVTVGGEERIVETVGGDTTYDHQLRAFVDAVEGKAVAPTGGADAVESMAVIDALYTAAGLGVRGI